MPICIYCRRTTTGTEGLPHVIPEALGRNKLTLACGDECDACNNALGKLDETLPLYPHISVGLQFFGVPGKQGRPRMQIGTVKRTSTGEVSLTIPAALLSVEEHAPGKRTVKIELPPPRGFKMPRFRRALHHVALNVVASMQGVDYVMDARFDPVRRYIKAPKVLGPGKVDAWPFAQGEMGIGRVPREVTVRHREKGQREIVSLQLLHLIFVVDLINSSTFAASVAKEGHHFIGPDVTAPWPARMTYVES